MRVLQEETLEFLKMDALDMLRAGRFKMRLVAMGLGIYDDPLTKATFLALTNEQQVIFIRESVPHLLGSNG